MITFTRCNIENSIFGVNYACNTSTSIVGRAEIESHMSWILPPMNMVTKIESIYFARTK